jgi:hypothetical protein
VREVLPVPPARKRRVVFQDARHHAQQAAGLQQGVDPGEIHGRPAQVLENFGAD